MRFPHVFEVRCNFFPFPTTRSHVQLRAFVAILNGIFRVKTNTVYIFFSPFRYTNIGRGRFNMGIYEISIRYNTSNRSSSSSSTTTIYTLRHNRVCVCWRYSRVKKKKGASRDRTRTVVRISLAADVVTGQRRVTITFFFFFHSILV